MIALFVFGTYVYRLFDTFPYVVFRGSKETGKPKSLKLIGALAFDAIEVTNLTGGALYLEVEAHGATLLLNDAEDLGDDEARAIKSMLNAGYGRMNLAWSLEIHAGSDLLTVVQDRMGIGKGRLAAIQYQRAQLQRVRCECTTLGWCWSCHEIGRLHAEELELLAQGGRQ